MRARLTTIIASWLMIMTADAQPYCSVKTFNLRNGLASNAITSICQTPDQLMWFSTWNGLTCYDGYRFTIFRDTPQDGQRVLTTNRMLSIETVGNGNIWCITYDLNAFLLDRSSGQYIDVTSHINRKFGTDFHTNRAITTPSGHTWLLNSETGGPAARIDDRLLTLWGSNSGDGIDLFAPSDEPLKANEIYWVFENSKGKEYLFTDKGLISIDGTDRTDRPYRFVQEIGQYLFLGSSDGTICMRDAQSKQQMELSLPSEVTGLSSLLQGGDGQLLAVTNAGFYVYDTHLHRGHLTRVPEEVNTLAMTRTIYIDSRHRLWMGTPDGDVLRVNLEGGDDVTLLPMSELTPTLRQSSHTFFHEDRYHTLWAATSQGFFGYYDEQQHRFVSCPLRTSITQPIVERWLFDAQGNLWFSGEHNLAMVSFGHSNITHVSKMQEVRSIMFDHQGRIWTGTLTDGY